MPGAHVANGMVRVGSLVKTQATDGTWQTGAVSQLSPHGNHVEITYDHDGHRQWVPSDRVHRQVPHSGSRPAESEQVVRECRPAPLPSWRDAKGLVQGLSVPPTGRGGVWV